MGSQTTAPIKERPILFSAPMVIALREDRKTQTRRTRGLDAINEAPDDYTLDGGEHDWSGFTFQHFAGPVTVRCPYGVAGDRLYTRETWAPFDLTAIRQRDTSLIFYRADDTRNLETDGTWKPSIHMPRWASRDTLEVVSARPERLHAITRDDAVAEGVQVLVDPRGCPDGKVAPMLPISSRVDSHALWSRSRPITEDDWYTGYYALLWEEINSPGSWAKNPWIWRVEFRRV